MATRWDQCQLDVLDFADSILNESVTDKNVTDVVLAAIVCTERQG